MLDGAQAWVVDLCAGLQTQDLESAHAECVDPVSAKQGHPLEIKCRQPGEASAYEGEAIVVDALLRLQTKSVQVRGPGGEIVDRSVGEE